MRRKIKIEFWNDPYSKTNEFKSEEEGDKVLAGRWGDSYANGEGEEEDIPESDLRPVLPTNFGMMPAEVYTKFNTTFRIWLANTTFRITGDVKRKIMKTEGVDAVLISSPYSFRFSVGKAFDAKKIRHNLCKNLDALPPPSGIDNPFGLKLTKSYEDIDVKMYQPHWGLILFPNNSSHQFETDDEDVYDLNMQGYKTLQEVTGAAIYSKTHNS